MYNPTIAPPFGGELQARSGGRKPGAACCQRVRRSGCRFRFDVPKGKKAKAIEGGRSLVGAYVRQGLPRRELFPDCPTMRTHARGGKACRPCDNVDIIARHIPAPGVLFKSFRAFRSPRCPHQLPPPSLSIKKAPSPSFSPSPLSQTYHNAPLA